MKEADILRHKWRKLLPQPSPIRCRKFKRTDLARLFATLGYRRGAEVGVREGVYSECLCKAIPGLDLTCVDLWGPYYHFNGSNSEEHYQTAYQRLAPYGCTLVRQASADAAKDVPDGSLDFVYIDADHRFDWVMMDLILWAPKVRSGGIVSGHDYYRFRNGGVVDAVDCYTRVHGIGEWWVTDEKEASFFWVQ